MARTWLMKLWVLVLGAVLVSGPAVAEPIAVPFDSDHWQFDSDAKLVTFDGRQALVGSGFVKDVELERGTLEADIWTNGQINFAGFLFHALSFRDLEWVFVRTHKSNGIIPDAIQYAPSFHGSVCWQLVADGLATANVPPRGWVHLKLEFSATHATLYVGDVTAPVLTASLRRNETTGKIGLRALARTSVYFANFRYSREAGPAPQAAIAAAPGMITKWRLSPAYAIATAGDLPLAYPTHEIADKAGWTEASADPDGLINISKVHESGAAASGSALKAKWAILSTHLKAGQAKTVKMNFGYSDAVAIFLDGKPLYFGNSTYQFRSKADGDWINLGDAVFLDLKKGRNELVVMTSEQFGGWGFKAQVDDTDVIASTAD